MQHIENTNFEQDIRILVKQGIKISLENNKSNDNIIFRTKDIKNSYYKPKSINGDTYKVLNEFKNAGYIEIIEVCKKNKIYEDPSTWLKYSGKINRYLINVLDNEHFLTNPIDDSNWAIKTYYDFEKKELVILLNGIEEEIRINFKVYKNGGKTKIIQFWEQSQTNVNEEFILVNSFARPRDSIRSFFKRFCVKLYDIILFLERGGARKVKFNDCIHVKTLKDKGIEELIFYPTEENEQKYRCKFDSNGKFLGWKKV